MWIIGTILKTILSVAIMPGSLLLIMVLTGESCTNPNFMLTVLIILGVSLLIWGIIYFNYDYSKAKAIPMAEDENERELPMWLMVTVLKTILSVAIMPGLFLLIMVLTGEPAINPNFMLTTLIALGVSFVVWGIVHLNYDYSNAKDIPYESIIPNYEHYAADDYWAHIERK